MRSHYKYVVSTEVLSLLSAEALTTANLYNFAECNPKRRYLITERRYLITEQRYVNAPPSTLNFVITKYFALFSISLQTRPELKLTGF